MLYPEVLMHLPAGTALRELVYTFRLKVLQLFKVLMLQKRVSLSQIHNQHNLKSFGPPADHVLRLARRKALHIPILLGIPYTRSVSVPTGCSVSK